MSTHCHHGRLPYADANATPWPINHHSYVYSCAERLGKELTCLPHVHLPETHLQHQEARRGLVFPSLETRENLFLLWDERYGWSSVESMGHWPLVLGADPLLSPDLFTQAVLALGSDHGRTVLIQEQYRARAHPVDVHFERQLAGYRAA